MGRTVYILAHGTDVPVAPGPDLLSALVSLALRREHVDVVLVGVLELLGVLVALRLHGVRTLHVRRLLLVVEARDFARRRAVAAWSCGGRRAERYVR